MPVLSVAIHGPLLCTYAQDSGDEIIHLETGGICLQLPPDACKQQILCMEHCVHSLRCARKAYGTGFASQFLSFSQPAGNSPLGNHENIHKGLDNAGRDHTSMPAIETLSCLRFQKVSRHLTSKGLISEAYFSGRPERPGES